MQQGKAVEVPCPVCDQPRRCEVFAPDRQAINPMEVVNCDAPRYNGCHLSPRRRLSERAVLVGQRSGELRRPQHASADRFAEVKMGKQGLAWMLVRIHHPNGFLQFFADNADRADQVRVV